MVNVKVIEAHAKIVHFKIVQILEAESDEISIEELTDIMRKIPKDVILSEKILGDALSDARKYLGDLDIREKDAEYDDYFREKLKNYRVELEALILNRLSNISSEEAKSSGVAASRHRSGCK